MSIKEDRSEIMKNWDDWRRYIANGGGGSWPRDSFECLLDYMEEKEEECEQYKKDAERYRWLRVDLATSAVPRVWQSNESAEPIKALHQKDLDKAIDKAMQFEKEKKND